MQQHIIHVSPRCRDGRTRHRQDRLFLHRFEPQFPFCRRGLFGIDVCVSVYGSHIRSARRIHRNHYDDDAPLVMAAPADVFGRIAEGSELVTV